MQTLLLFIGLILALSLAIWGARRVWQAIKATRFISEANDVQGIAYGAPTAEERGKARRRFEEMAEEAGSSKNSYIRTRDVGETMLGYASSVVQIARDINTPEIAEIEEWEERVRSHLTPLLYEKRIEGK